MHERGGLADRLQPLVVQLLRRAVAVAVELRLRGDELVEQLALAVLAPRVGERARERERLAEGAAALGSEEDHARGDRAFLKKLPLLGGEVAFRGHFTFLRQRRDSR